MTSRGFPSLTYASLVASALLASCGGGDGGGGVEPPPTPAAVTAVSGNGQTGRAGAVLADQLTVRVTASTGSGMEGISVSFTAGATSGTVSSPAVVTDADGSASITWTLGTEPGQNV